MHKLVFLLTVRKKKQNVQRIFYFSHIVPHSILSRSTCSCPRFLKALFWPNMAGLSTQSGGAAGQLILLCGPSGVGKSSIASELAAARQLELLSQERT